MSDSPIILCALLWARPGREESLIAYEHRVLDLLPEHGARVVHRAVNVDAEPTQPLEVQVLEFPCQAAFSAFLADPRRRALGSERETLVARTTVFQAEVVGAQPASDRDSD